MSTTQSPEPASISGRYDEVAPTYESAGEGDIHRKLIWMAYDHLTWKAVEAWLPADRSLRVLDAGGGSGKFSRMFAERGHHVTVLDLSPAMVEQARTKLTEAGFGDRADFHVGSILELPFADATFDFVFCEGDPVSYCLEEYPKAMAELVRVAVPGGPVVLGVDSRFDAFTGVMKHGDPKDAMAILHTGRMKCPYGLPVHAFTIPELKKGMEAAGAEVVEIFGKPVLFWDTLTALEASRGPDFDPWEARHELLALQDRLSREFAAAGTHYQVMARRRR